MVCTFGDLTDVVWWRELGLPVRSVLGPDGRLADVPVGRARAGSRATSSARARATSELRGQDRQPGAQTDRRAAASSRASSSASRTPVTRAVKFFEKGERPVEIVTSRQWFIRTIEHREALIARGRELRVAPAVHARALRGLGQRADGRLVRQPPALLRRAVPASGIRSTSERRGAARPPDRRARGAAPGRSLDRRARRVSRPRSAGSRTASPATRT